MGSFSVWHLIILLTLAAIPAALIALIVWGIRYQRRRGSPVVPGNTPAQRLDALEELKRDGLISQTEYATQRAQILSSL